MEVDQGFAFSKFSDDDCSDAPETAHQISSDSWFQVGLVLTTGVNSVFVLGYSGAIMVPLGWIGGVAGLLLSTVVSLYASCLIAKLHEFGDKRHIRYRDLARHIYGSAMKAVYALYRDDHVLKLPHCIAVAGFVCIIFAISTPHLSSLRIWLGVSTFFSLVYIIVACVLSLKDGIRSPPRDYSILGTTTSRIFTTIGASANLVFAYNTGMIPEIQATVKQPAVKNMLKALYFQFSIGNCPLYAVTFIGYWAYGSSSSAYLLNNVHGSAWVKVFANICAFLQSIIALHIFASPTYEYLDTKFEIKGSALKLTNLSFRIVARGGYLIVNTLVAAALPFLGDFMSLTGALSTFPLTFILAHHMYVVANKNTLTSLQKLWHWLNVAFFSVVCAASVVSALRLIAVDSNQYHVFADM